MADQRPVEGLFQEARTINILDHVGLTNEELGRAVQSGWRDWALTLPNPPAAWLRTWEEVSPAMQEADKMIGLGVLKRIVEAFEVCGLSQVINEVLAYHYHFHEGTVTEADKNYLLQSIVEMKIPQPSHYTQDENQGPDSVYTVSSEIQEERIDG